MFYEPIIKPVLECFQHAPKLEQSPPVILDIQFYFMVTTHLIETNVIPTKKESSFVNNLF